MEGRKDAVTQLAMAIGLERREFRNQLRREDWNGGSRDWIDSPIVVEIEELLVGE